MHTPAHLGGLLRDNIDAMGWSVAECAGHLDISPAALSRLLNGHSRISPRVALALERLGWSTAGFWMRVQAGHQLAQLRKEQAA